MTTYTPIKNIISNENFNEDMGYLVENYDNGSINAKFWVFTNNGEEINEKNVKFNSLRDLYDESKIFVNSDLINHSLLHESKYKMMCDFIKYYENTLN